MKLDPTEIVLLIPENSDLELDAPGVFGMDTEVDRPEGLEKEKEPPVDPRDVFGDEMRFEVPKLSLEQNDVIAKEIVSGLTPVDHLPCRDDDLSVRPYCPNPLARALDYIVDYEFDSENAQSTVEGIRSRVGSTSRIIAGELRRVIASRSLGSVERDRTSGRIDRRKLHSLNLPNRQPNLRVFEEKVKGEAQNVAIGLLIDQSGSMNAGRKIQRARDATVALADALQGLTALGVRFGIWGFDSDSSKAQIPNRGDRDEPLRFHHYKGFSERWDRVYGRVAHMNGLQNNCDGECVRWAGHQLLNERVDRRILIVLSDGAPCCRGFSDARIEADLKVAVSQLGDRGIEVIGLGILDRAVQDYYPNNLVIRSVKDLEGALMGLLRKMLLDNGRRAA